MLGNILSAFIWLRSTTFDAYLLSRVVGGLSEANVQISLVAISDVVPAAERSRTLALVGLAFSPAFTFGPPIGAYLAKYPLDWRGVNIYALPALISLFVLVVETTVLALALPETRASQSAPAASQTAVSTGRLTRLERLHTAFLLVFAGCEFTLTFLAFDLLGYSNAQNGALLGTIGAISAMTQGGFVRRTKLGSGALARSGMLSCALALGLLATLPRLRSVAVLYAAGVLLAYTSATVVNGLTALVAVEAPEAARGAVMGRFRSAGQLGRALGPMAATALYWASGPRTCYAVAAAAMAAIWGAASRLDVVKPKAS